MLGNSISCVIARHDRSASLCPLDGRCPFSLVVVRFEELGSNCHQVLISISLGVLWHVLVDVRAIEPSPSPFDDLALDVIRVPGTDVSVAQVCFPASETALPQDDVAA